ncbi:MAG: hypothetical protein ACE5OW_04890 [Candidatus Bathyarchaeia archaeon]
MHQTPLINITAAKVNAMAPTISRDGGRDAINTVKAINPASAISITNTIKPVPTIINGVGGGGEEASTTLRDTAVIA